MEYITLNNGVKMPLLGLGVFQVPDHRQASETVSKALELGYRHVDTAAAYLNEAAVGQALKESGLKREEYFVTTKLWVQDHGYENTLRAFDTSAQKLGLDVVVR